ncbi:hypothetical protein MTR_1g033780 [Medicago truncatula]|uniref:Uncharacterized protein n=1 Tax=Medicago truncatula TaxID=3880 RepID=A0A072VRG0_MEDTR|nr:hypothetical protein MTR_1g033780 [Medicago truncatula]
MASVLNRLPSNKVISRISYPHGLSFRPNNSRYLFLLEAAPADHTVILTCGAYTSRFTRFIPPMFCCTCWSHSDPSMWGLTTLKVHRMCSRHMVLLLGPNFPLFLGFRLQTTCLVILPTVKSPEASRILILGLPKVFTNIQLFLIFRFA